MAHWIICATLLDFWFGASSHTHRYIAGVFFLLSLSFVIASILSMRFSGGIVRVIYTTAALWLGFVDFLVLGAAGCWLIWALMRLAHVATTPRLLVGACFGGAVAAGIYGLVNAAVTRVKRISVRLPGLPEQWHGRIAVVASDMHLGNVRGAGFARRTVQLINSQKPCIIFIVGDVFDGAATDPIKLVEPFAGLQAHFGTYFVTGNHEEFGDSSRFVKAIQGTGIRVLENEKVCVDGLQVFGVNFHTSVHPARYEEVFAEAAVDREVASVALGHAPNNPRAAEKAGISLQVSGHTHRGQLFPFTWFTERIYKDFVYGLHNLRETLVLTTCGAGTWGPPMRVGTNPEIVSVEFE